MAPVPTPGTLGGIHITELLDWIQDGVLTLDREWRCTYVNRKAAELIGRRLEEVLGINLWEAFPDHVGGPFYHAAQGAMRDQVYAQLEDYYPAQSRWFEKRIHPTPEGLLVVFQDITERRARESALRQSEERLRALIAQVPAVVWVADNDLRLTSVQGAHSPPLEPKGSTDVGRHVSELAYEGDTAEVVEAHEKARSGETARYTVTYWGRTYEAVVEPLRDADGAIAGVIGTALDVTDEIEIRRRLEESEARFRAVFESAPVGIGIGDTHTRTLACNPALQRLFGYTTEELNNLTFRGLTHPDDVARSDAMFKALLQEEVDRYQIEKRYVRKDGSVFWARLTNGRMPGTRNSQEGVAIAVAIIEDITEQQHAAARLRESEERFRALVESAWDLIAIVDPELRPSYLSPSHEAALGYSLDELRAIDLWTLIHPDDHAFAREQLTKTIKRGAMEPERLVRIRAKDGSYHSLAVRITDLRENQAVRGIVVNSRDMTEWQELEARLHQAEKLEALGRLAGGIAHDLNNILAAISGYAELVESELPAASPQRAEVGAILEAVTRGASIMQQLLVFSRGQPLVTEPLDLAGVVRETGGLLRPLLPETITLELPREDGSAIVRANRGQIEQVVMNLALNARDAMPEGGTLSLSVTTEGEDGAPSAAVLSVRDAGIGMSKEVRARIFEPFFTTKELGKGSGLGLATVHGVVRQLGGSIEVDSEEGVGSNFVVRLPLVRSPAAGASDQASGRAEAPRTVLVVEDEAPVRYIVQRLLERAGYRIITAPDGITALGILKAREAKIDLVLTDATMPIVSGRDLAAQIASHYPGTPVVLMSGYAEPSADAPLGARLPGITAFLQKPFSGAQLVQVLAEALGGASPARPA